MPLVRITVTHSECRCGYCREGDTFLVEDVCPPICMELWHAAYPYVFALRHGASLDCGKTRRRSFEVQCPDGGRVRIRGEAVEDDRME